MHTSNYLYHHREQELHGYLAYDDKTDEPRPAVLVAHDWSGRTDFACDKAVYLAELGYVGFAIDMYGLGRIGETLHEKKALMEPLLNDRFLLLERIRAAFDAVIAMPEVDISRIAAIGFCFGGLCVLDLARSSKELKAAVSFHGNLTAPPKPLSSSISAKILALHGYDDPLVTPKDLLNFCDEMTQLKADWQAHIFGNAQHAFTNPHAHDHQLGTVYQPKAERRAMNLMKQFLRDMLK